MARKPDREKHARQDKTRKPDYREEMPSRGPSYSLDLKKIIAAGKAAKLKKEKLETQRRMAEVRIARRMDIVICPALTGWMAANEIDQSRLKQAIKAVIVAAATQGDPGLLSRSTPGKFLDFNQRSACRFEKSATFEIKSMPALFVPWLLKFKQTHTPPFTSAN